MQLSRLEKDLELYGEALEAITSCGPSLPSYLLKAGLMDDKVFEKIIKIHPDGISEGAMLSVNSCTQRGIEEMRNFPYNSSAVEAILRVYNNLAGKEKFWGKKIGKDIAVGLVSDGVISPYWFDVLPVEEDKRLAKEISEENDVILIHDSKNKVYESESWDRYVIKEGEAAKKEHKIMHMLNSKGCPSIAQSIGYNSIRNCFVALKVWPKGNLHSLEDELSSTQPLINEFAKKVCSGPNWISGYDQTLAERIKLSYKHIIAKRILWRIAEMQKKGKGILEGKKWDYGKVFYEKFAKRYFPDKPNVIIKNSQPILEHLESMPRHFSHGDLNPRNIRLWCSDYKIIDFEHAALASGLFDAAYFLERPQFNFPLKSKIQLIDYFTRVSGRSRKNLLEDYCYNAAYVNMRIAGGCITWQKNEGKDYSQAIKFHINSALEYVSMIMNGMPLCEEQGKLGNLKKSLEGLRIR
jgi:hypothetical protein